MKYTTVFVVLLNLLGCGWKTHDKVIASTFVIGQALDAMQTREIMSNDSFVEKNKVIDWLGYDEVYPIFITTTLGAILIAGALPEKYRTPFLIGSTIFSYSFVLHNHSIGVNLKF